MCRDRMVRWARRYLGACFIFVVCFGFICHGFSEMPLPVGNLSVSEEIQMPIVILDAGHGGEDCGAIGLNGVYEKDINFSVAGYLAARLRAVGVTVVETRKDDHLLYDPNEVAYGYRKMTDLANRAAIANAYEAAVFVSIHMNSFPTEHYDGLQVWYGNRDEEGKRLAEVIQRTVKTELQPTNNRKIKPSNGNMYLLDYVECPSVLVECGFLTNRVECEKLSQEEYQKELSFVLFCAIMNYLDIEEAGKT